MQGTVVGGANVEVVCWLVVVVDPQEGSVVDDVGPVPVVGGVVLDVVNVLPGVLLLVVAPGAVVGVLLVGVPGAVVVVVDPGAVVVVVPGVGPLPQP